jgi:two-component system response regulator YesN
MFTEILVCLEEQYETSVEKAKRALRVVLKEKENLEYTMLEVPKEKALMIIIHDYKKVEELERWFQNRVILGKSIDVPISFGWTNVIGLGQLKNGIQILMKYMDWNIVLGEHVMISYPKIMQIQTVPCIYPIEIENKIKVSLCANQLSETQNLILNFNESFHDGKVYTPKEIKECYIRFIWSMINVAKEIGNIDSEYLEQRSILESIINAKDSRTLAAIINQIYSKIIFVTGEKGEITNLVVRRAQSLIHEFYQTGITLEEIASKLNITPEYLSSQFHKETGVLFSGYIKNYRINKAKELLISTTLKQYDVANQVGYGDPKYFGRVFRECTGLRPLDYRNLQR